jgi:two-component system, LytTR family, sensor kinase
MDKTETQSESRRWLWIAVIWSAIGLFDEAQNVFVMRAKGIDHYWTRLFATLLFSWLPWMLEAPLVLRLSRRYPPTRRPRASVWAAHLGACAGIGPAFAAWVALWVRPYPCLTRSQLAHL